MNSLNSKTIEKQLFYLAKEAVKYLVSNSKCGITIPASELKLKNLPNFDINTINSFSPLLCLYKKSSAKLTNINGKLCFDDDSLKKDITIEGNALMTLSILELIDYYSKFKDIDTKKHSIGTFYFHLARKQLEFYAANLRNIEGVFVDKKHIAYELEPEYKFEEKNKKFKYCDQALLMSAFYKYSLYDETSCGSEYRTFSMDIFNMLLQYKDELYLCSFHDILKVCLSLNLLYKYSSLNEVKILLLDLMEFLNENMDDYISIQGEDSKIEFHSLFFINSMLLYNNTGILKFRDISEEIYNGLLELYEPEQGIFIKFAEKKEVDYTNTEIVSYLLSILLHENLTDNSKDGNMIIVDVFKRQIIDSGLILSWPASPDLDDVERYKNFSSKAEDLLEEQDFRMSSLPTPESSELPPIFIKHVSYNKKKEIFSQSKLTFDSTKNMFIFFLIIYLNKFFNK